MLFRHVRKPVSAFKHHKDFDQSNMQWRSARQTCFGYFLDLVMGLTISLLRVSSLSLTQIKESFSESRSNESFHSQVLLPGWVTAWCESLKDISRPTHKATPLIHSLFLFVTLMDREGYVCDIIHETNCAVNHSQGKQSAHWRRLNRCQLSQMSCSLWTICSQMTHP
jgi:hypothetical protein